MSATWSTKGVKDTPVGADEVVIIDSEDANLDTKNKRVAVSNFLGGGIGSINGDTTTAQVLAGTSNRISLVDAGATHTFDIASSYVGQSSITTLGTIATGIWNGTDIALANIVNGAADQVIKTNAGGTALEFGLINNANITAHTSTKITINAKGQLNSAIVYNDQTNTFGDFLQTFRDNRLKINSPDDADGVIFVNSNQTADRNLTIPILTANRNIVVTGESSQITLGTEVTGAITNLSDVTAKTGTGTTVVFGTSPTIVTPVIASFTTAQHNHANAAGGGQLLSTTALSDTANIAYLNTANVFGDFDQTFKDNRLLIENPAGTFKYQIVAAAITADRILNLPLLIGTDTIVTEAFTQTLTNKTLTTPIIASFTNAQHNHQNAAGGGVLVATLALTATGTKDATTFLRGDNTWAVPVGDMVLSAVQTVTGAKTFGTIGGAVGKFILAGSTSGSTILNAAAVAGAGTVVLPTTGTLATLAGSETLTNKTLTTPTIASFTNATHNHTNAAGGGQLLSTTALSDTADIAYLNTANIYTAGTRQNFLGLLAGTAGMNVGGIAGNPTTQVNGDVWYNSSTNKLLGRIGGVNIDLGAAGTSTPPFADTTSIVEGSTDPTKEIRFEADTNVPTATVIVITAPSSDSTLVNTTDGLIRNANVDAAAAIVTTKLADSANFVLTNKANTFGDFAQTFLDDKLFIQNPAATFTFQISAPGIAGNRTITLPLLTGNDTFVTEAFAQTLTNKTLTSPTLTTPTIASFTNAQHNHTNAAGGGILLSTTALSDTADIAYLNTTNTYTAGTRQNFLGLLAGTAGMNVGGIAGNPTTQVNGDIWLNTSSNILFGRINGINVDLGLGAAPFDDATALVKGSADATKLLRFEVDGGTTGITGVIATVFTTAKTITIPDATDTLVGRATTDSLTNKTFNNTNEFEDNGLIIQNPANTFNYIFQGSAIVSQNRTITLPILTSSSTTLAFSDFANVWGIVNQNIASTGKWQEAGVSISPIGTHTQWIAAGAWGSVATNGAEFEEFELATNDIMLQTFNFDQTTSEKIQFWWEPPAEWNAGTITFNTKWTAASGTGTVTWKLEGHSYSDSDAIDSAIGGTSASVTDTLITANDMHISPESGNVTINTATKGEAVLLQLSRDVADTLTADAKLIGINITFTTDEATKD